jgi:hypothetical protein
VDLVGALIEVSLGKTPSVAKDGIGGVVTRLGLMGILESARRRGSRQDVANELKQLLTGAGRYKNSSEELTPISTDFPGVIPCAIVTASLLCVPSAWQKFSGQTVNSYSLTPEAFRKLRQWANA